MCTQWSQKLWIHYRAILKIENRPIRGRPECDQAILVRVGYPWITTLNMKSVQNIVPLVLLIVLVGICHGETYIQVTFCYTCVQKSPSALWHDFCLDPLDPFWSVCIYETWTLGFLKNYTVTLEFVNICDLSVILASGRSYMVTSSKLWPRSQNSQFNVFFSWKMSSFPHVLRQKRTLRSWLYWHFTFGNWIGTRIGTTLSPSFTTSGPYTRRSIWFSCSPRNLISQTLDSFCGPYIHFFSYTCQLPEPQTDSWSLSHLGHLYPGTTPVMIKLDHNRSCPWV